MIRNRNLIFGKANKSSPAADKYLEIPRIPAANAATAASAIDGALYWDSTNSKLYCCKGGTWKEVTVAS